MINGGLDVCEGTYSWETNSSDERSIESSVIGYVEIFCEGEGEGIIDDEECGKETLFTKNNISR